jgi:transcriptional regulator with XRE-family HTH domain
MVRAQLTFQHLNQTELAKASGLTPGAISRILSSDPRQRRANPSLETLQKLQAGLRRLTRRKFSIEQIASAIKAQSAAQPV